MTVEAPGVAASGVIRELQAIRDGIAQLHNRMERPAPTIWRSPFPEHHPKLRNEWWVISFSGAGTASLQIGTAVVYIAEVAAADTIVIPLPITIERAANVAVVAQDNVVDSMLIGYTE
jgi:hypothetical protein